MSQWKQNGSSCTKITTYLANQPGIEVHPNAAGRKSTVVIDSNFVIVVSQKISNRRIGTRTLFMIVCVLLETVTALHFYHTWI